MTRQVDSGNIETMICKVTCLQVPGTVIHGSPVHKNQPGQCCIMRPSAVGDKSLFPSNLNIHSPNPAARL